MGAETEDKPDDTSTPEIDYAKIAQMVAEQMQPAIDKAVTGAAGRTKKDLTKLVESMFAQKPAEGEGEDKPVDPVTPPLPTKPEEKDNPYAAQIAELQAKLTAQARKSAELEQKVAQAGEETIAQKIRAERVTAEGEFFNTFKSDIVSPRDFLTVAMRDGQIEFKDGKLVTTKEEYGEKSFVPVTKDFVTGLLKDDSPYSYLKNPRPGTGTDSTSTTTTPRPGTSKYFGANEVDNSALAAVAFEKGMDELINDLVGTAS